MNRLISQIKAHVAYGNKQPIEKRSKATIEEISDFLQKKLREENQNTVTANEAALWLDEAGLLKDSKSRPGAPLRKLLRDEDILGKRQVNDHWWYIDRESS